MISIIDFGLGNIQSVKNVLKKVNVKSEIINTPKEVLQAKKLILPGVGHFKQGMKNLNELNLIDPIIHKVMTEKTPILGICLGMQLLTKKSEEGDVNGLGLINATTIGFSIENNIKIPHMGWNEITVMKKNPLFNENEPQRFYFVHSFFVDCKNESDILTTTFYGKKFCSGFSNGNIFGFQFHPEKSHKYGFSLMEKFAHI